MESRARSHMRAATSEAFDPTPRMGAEEARMSVPSSSPSRLDSTDSLAKKADLLDLLFEATNEGVVDWNLVANEVRYNERWRFLLGWDEASFALTPTTWRELIHDDDRPHVEQALRDHLDEGWPFEKTVRMRRRGADWHWILLRGAAHRNDNGEPQRMVIIFADVHERVCAESEVRALIEAIPDSIVRLRLDGTLLAFKDARGQASTRDRPTLGVIDVILGSEAGERALEKVRSGRDIGGVTQVHGQLQRDVRDGAYYELRIVRSGADEIVCILRDVTGERNAEEQLLRGMKLAAVGQLAAGMAHEINTPLQYVGDNFRFAADVFPTLLGLIDDFRAMVAANAATSPASLAEMGRKEEIADLPYLRQALPGALCNGLDGLGQIARIVAAMRAFESAGQSSRTWVDLNPLVGNAAHIGCREFEEAAELSLRLSPDLPQVPCVPGEIAQVVVNLVANAAHAVADKVGDADSMGHITVETLHLPAEDAVEIRVTDDGVGIPEHIRDRVFDPFFTTRSLGHGSGQGLAHVQAAVVQLHGGTVSFDSRESKGTCFRVRLPLRERKDEGAETAVEPGA